MPSSRRSQLLLEAEACSAHGFSLQGTPHRKFDTTAIPSPKETAPTFGVRQQAGLSPTRGAVPLLHYRRKVT